MERLGLSVTQGAEIHGVTRPTLSKVINSRASISPEMAIRLSKAFGGNAATWVKMQVAYDLAQAEKRAHIIKVKRYKPVSV